MIDIIALCPGGVATGGTESIHKLVSELKKIADAKILYFGETQNPMPLEYEEYGCDWIADFPDGYTGVVIVPEIWANDILDPRYKNCTVAVNWAGVDVYDWHNPPSERGRYLERKDAIHLAQSEYAMDFLRKQGLECFKISDVLNDAFFDVDTDTKRNDVVLYNPVKATGFQYQIMKAAQDRGVEFKPITGMSRHQVIETLRHAKLYIDFGVFSGRERIPREAAMCGCCVLTSFTGAAKYYQDVAIDYEFKPVSVEDAVDMITAILSDYEAYKGKYEAYRQSIINDRKLLPEQCRIIVNEFTKIQHNNTGS